ncbi:MAG: hypothetical protein WC556_14355 [Candidatus Methanoperedens sp.]
MTNKKLVYFVGIFAIFALIGGMALISSSNSTNTPITIKSSNLWDSNVLNASYLAKGSDTIAMGKVKEVLPSKWNTPDGKRPIEIKNDIIYTDVIIEVEQYLKNPQASKDITVRTLGGTVGIDSMVAEDEPKFEPNEKVILFLTNEDTITGKIGEPHLKVQGGMHGKFTITADQQAVRPDLPQEYKSMPLEELLKKIQ